MDENQKKLIEAAKKAVAKAQGMDPLEHFKKMVARGIIDSEGAPTGCPPLAVETKKQDT